MTILRFSRIFTVSLGLLWLLMTVINAESRPSVSQQDPGPFGTLPPVAPVLINPDFECSTGYYTQTNSSNREILIPNGWQVAILDGAPVISSARIFFAKSCAGEAHVEKINLRDSIVIRAQDLETPPAPGKPFDVAFQQSISATVGGAYSLSGWFLSLCGGSATPSDCPEGIYMAKMLGIDPTGGTDANAASVIWTENRRNFWEGERVGWQQISVSAMAQAPTITIFARVKSPFRWHGNHAFIDALSLVRAPVSALTLPTVVTGTGVLLQWEGLQSPDIAAIAGGTYRLLYDIQARQNITETWTDFRVGETLTQTATFIVGCVDTVYEFRLRARAEQPDPPAPAGAWPNHRYLGLWSNPIPVQIQSQNNNTDTPVDPILPADPAEPHRLYLPQVATAGTQRTCIVDN